MTSERPAFQAQQRGEIQRRIDDDMEATTGKSGFSARERIALACRHLADEGHALTLAGQISVKQDDGTFWTTGFATGFADAAVSNLVRVTEDLEVLDGPGMANPATRFHMWVYANRPDVRSVVHTHPPHASTLAMSGEPLIVSHMDMMMFHDDVAQLLEWPGVPLANEEGEIISNALGDKNSILLANHGILTAGESLEKAVFLAVHLEHAARLQLLGAAARYKSLPVSPDLAAATKAFVTKPTYVGMTFDYWCRQTARRHPQALD